MIKVNQTAISEKNVMAEMQYHAADSQRAAALGLAVSADSVKASDGDFIEALLAAEVLIPKASDAECAQYYHANPSRFVSSPLLEVRHILLAAAPDDDEGRVTAKQQAEEILLALTAGDDFGALAKGASACPSKEVGGSLGQISRGQTVPEFERQLFAAEAGLLPRPIESRYGFHVVNLERKVPGKQLPYAAVEEQIANYLNEKVRRKAIAQYIQTLIAEAHIEGYDFAVSSSPLVQ